MRRERELDEARKRLADANKRQYTRLAAAGVEAPDGGESPEGNGYGGSGGLTGF